MARRTELPDSASCVIIGGGVGGTSIAYHLAKLGWQDVVILERQYEFRDRVRGENMQPWGVVEMQRLGIEDVLIAAGGGYCTGPGTSSAPLAR